ncbi:MAG TPA: hypothetical protein VFB62_28125 [Polyangiaceae bacterium]|jgi:hypothetical protein|nr:hypothetical protein [Polyangiaceae bacterium]
MPRHLFVRTVAALSSFVSLACSFDWDLYDPRTGEVSVASTGSGGGATQTVSTTGTGGAGGDGGEQSGGAPPLGPFDPPQLVAALSDPADDDDPTFTADGLELYFNSNRSGTADVWKSVRDATNEPWGTPEIVLELSSSTAFDSNFLVSPDGLSFWMSSDREGQGLTDIFVSTRSSRTSPWSTPMLVPELNSTTYENPSGILDNLLLLLVDRGDQLHFSTRMSLTDPWTPLVPIAELNVSSYNSDGWLKPDALTIYFTSDRTGNVDLYVTTRRTPNGAFEEPAPVSELNSVELDSDPCLSPDTRYIMFSRTMGGMSPREIYEASR